jgi:hypothetical protein
MSDWMKVMLEEIANKQAEQQAARQEHERRRGDPAGPRQAGSGGRPDDDPASG